MSDEPERWRHPESEPDEVWIGNMFASDLHHVGWKSKRLGKAAYDVRGKTIPNFRPVFVGRTELDVAGAEIPPGFKPVDHRW